MDPPPPRRSQPTCSDPARADGALREPVLRHEGARWRAAVLDLSAATRGLRIFGPTLHAGDPVGHRVSFVPPPPPDLDPALRTDLVVALLDRALVREPTPALWLTRTGDLGLHDEDAAWLAAAEGAALECGLALPLVVVTRRGWRDPRSDVRREWRRLRQR